VRFGSYAILLYPVSFAISFIFDYTLQVTMGYSLSQHPEAPTQMVVVVIMILSDSEISAAIVVKLYQRIWPKELKLKQCRPPSTTWARERQVCHSARSHTNSQSKAKKT
jgi:hypothetical protein